MATEQDNKTDQKKDDRPTIQPEPETLHTTDPQEEMKGPVSSLMQGLKEDFEDKGESKEEADKKKKDGM